MQLKNGGQNTKQENNHTPKQQTETVLAPPVATGGFLYLHPPTSLYSTSYRCSSPSLDSPFPLPFQTTRRSRFHIIFKIHSDISLLNTARQFRLVWNQLTSSATIAITSGLEVLVLLRSSSAHRAARLTFRISSATTKLPTLCRS